VRLQSTLAKIASGAITISGTGNVNFAADSVAKPLALLRRRNAVHLGHFPDEFMAGSTAKALITAQNLDVGVANSGKPNADECPPAPQPGQRFLDSP
jgi:hypothetical protein